MTTSSLDSPCPSDSEEFTTQQPLSSSKLLEPEEIKDTIFKNMRLRRIIKENHCSFVNQIAFFHFPSTSTDSQSQSEQHLNLFSSDTKKFKESSAVSRRTDEQDTSNVLATVGSTQANIYDNQHIGDHLDIMSHFSIDGQGYEAPTSVHQNNTLEGELFTCMWLPVQGDGVLLAAGSDSIIHVLSLAFSKEIAQLEGHTGYITELKLSPHNAKLVLSACKDGTVRLWLIDVENNVFSCLAVYSIKASCLCFHPDGKTFLVGGYEGEIKEFNLPEDCFGDIMALETPTTISADQGKTLFGPRKCHSVRIDCMAFSGDYVLSKSVNGKLLYWDYTTKETIHSYNIRGGSNNFCRFDISQDGNYFCVGNSTGTVYVYSLQTGKCICELKHKRSTKIIRCCAFSPDCRYIIYGGEDGFIWRYDHIDDKTLEEWSQLQKR